MTSWQTGVGNKESKGYVSGSLREQKRDGQLCVFYGFRGCVTDKRITVCPRGTRGPGS